MLRPNGTHLFVCRELALRGGRHRSNDGRVIFGAQVDRVVVITGIGQNHSSDFVLHFGRKALRTADRLFKEFRHSASINGLSV